jgi:hypothetical protein
MVNSTCVDYNNVRGCTRACTRATQRACIKQVTFVPLHRRELSPFSSQTKSVLDAHEPALSRRLSPSSFGKSSECDDTRDKFINN